LTLIDLLEEAYDPTAERGDPLQRAFDAERPVTGKELQQARNAPACESTAGVSYINAVLLCSADLFDLF